MSQMNMRAKNKIVVIGASSNPIRYSYKAVSLLLEKGHDVIPVSPREKEVLGLRCYRDMKEIPPQPIHTVSMYVNPDLSINMLQDLIKLHPHRVIFNPGSENPRLYSALEKGGIRVEEACTLVLLRTDQF